MDYPIITIANLNWEEILNNIIIVLRKFLNIYLLIYFVILFKHVLKKKFNWKSIYPFILITIIYIPKWKYHQKFHPKSLRNSKLSPPNFFIVFFEIKNFVLNLIIFNTNVRFLFRIVYRKIQCIIIFLKSFPLISTLWWEFDIYILWVATNCWYKALGNANAKNLIIIILFIYYYASDWFCQLKAPC